MRHPLGRAERDADQVRDDVCGHVVEHPHDNRAVLVVDETGDVKKGPGTVGVRRRHTATTGRVENSQVAVSLVTQASAATPQSTGNDPGRCRAAGLAEENHLHHRAGAGTRTAARFLDAGHQAARVAGDEVHGGTGGPCGHLVQEGARAGLAEALRRGRDQGATASQPGSHRLPRSPPGESSATGPPTPQHSRTRLLSLLLARIRAADRAGRSRRIKVAGGGVLPVGQGPGRTRRAPGSPLYLLVPAGTPSPCSRTLSSPSHARTSTPAPHPKPSSSSPATRSSACSPPSSSDPSHYRRQAIRPVGVHRSGDHADGHAHGTGEAPTLESRSLTWCFSCRGGGI